MRDGFVLGLPYIIENRSASSGFVGRIRIRRSRQTYLCVKKKKLPIRARIYLARSYSSVETIWLDSYSSYLFRRVAATSSSFWTSSQAESL